MCIAVRRKAEGITDVSPVTSDGQSDVPAGDYYRDATDRMKFSDSACCVIWWARASDRARKISCAIREARGGNNGHHSTWG